MGLKKPEDDKNKLNLQTMAQNALNPGQVTSDTASGPATNPWAGAPLRTETAAAPTETMQVAAAQLPANFQWTGEFDAANRGLQQQESDAGFKRNQTLQQIADTYLRGTQDAAVTQGKARNSLFADLASRGMLGSSPTLKSDAELSTNYNRYLDSLSRAKAGDTANVENSYASVLNQTARQREGLASQQQAAEEQRRLAEAQAKAEAERQAQEAQMRQQEIQQLIAAQEQARQAAESAAQMAAANRAQISYSMPSMPSIGYGGGYDGGYDAPSESAPQQEERIVLPFNGATSGPVPRTAVENWVRNNVDPNLSGPVLNSVITALSGSGTMGMTRSQLANIIATQAGAGTNIGNAAKNAFMGFW